jgi:hypothetical protein
LGKAQAFADLVGISRYRGRVHLSASWWWKTGRLTRERRVPLEVGDHFHDPEAIGRYVEESGQSPTTGTKGGRLITKRRIFLAQDDCFHRLVFIGVRTKPLVEPKTRLGRPTEQTGLEARIFGIFDLQAVNFPESMCIRECRGSGRQ